MHRFPPSSEEGHPDLDLEEIRLEGQRLSIGQVYRLGQGGVRLAVTRDPDVLERMHRSAELVRRAVDQGLRIYGVTSGFGGMANVPVPPEQAEVLQANLLSFLAAGAGRPIPLMHVRAAMGLRANMLLRGASGVRVEIVERLVTWLNAGACPVVSEFGSIGASGDLVPLAVIARAITGQGPKCRVRIGGREIDSRKALKLLGMAPLELNPKEALAIINGTTFSAAIAANAIHAARDLFALTLGCHVMMLRALLGHEEPFSTFVHECKPHPGQQWVARMMRELLAVESRTEAQAAVESSHLQDRYSLRCLPQYLGPIAEGLTRITEVIEIEMNAITDNPLVNVQEERFYQSGNFLGQYIGMAMDDLRRYLGLMAKHLDVQIAQLVEPAFNHGLPASLNGNSDLAFNMGLKGLQITGNSIMPMLTHLGNPLVEHYPTHAEQFNQNINGLSWGGANLAMQSVDTFAQYAAVSLIFAVQAVDLRAFASHGHHDGRVMLGPLARDLYEAVHNVMGRRPGAKRPLIFNDGDHSLEEHLAALSDSIRQRGRLIEAIAPLVDSVRGMGGTAEPDQKS